MGKQIGKKEFWTLNQFKLIHFYFRNTNENNEDGKTPTNLKLRKISRKRFQKENIALLEFPALKFRKTLIKTRKRTTKEIKRIQNLPYEILHLEETIGNSNPHKTKLYTLSNEHLGFSSDLRSNFPFDPSNFFLKIDNCHGDSSRPQYQALIQSKLIVHFSKTCSNRTFSNYLINFKRRW